MIEKNPLIPQKDIWTSQLMCQSFTIKYLEIKLPMTWPSLISLLDYFPNLKTFRASLYQINSNTYDTLFAKPAISCLNSLQTLDLYGYFHDMSSIVTYFCSSISNLKRCYLRAMNVTNDNGFQMKDGLIWKLLFDSCPYLIRVNIHLHMNIEENNYYNVRCMRDLMRTFNNNSLCEKYNFRMAQLSINHGYLTLTGDFDKKKKLDCDSFCS
jgi:hypothetical protein